MMELDLRPVNHPRRDLFVVDEPHPSTLQQERNSDTAKAYIGIAILGAFLLVICAEYVCQYLASIGVIA